MRSPWRNRAAGETLIELLVAVAILGITFPAVLGAMGVGILSADVHRTEADGTTTALSAVEQVKAASFVSCATPASYLTAAQSVTAPQSWTSPPASWTPAKGISITQVLYWDGASFQATCQEHDSDATPLTLQLITLKVQGPATGQATCQEARDRTCESMDVIKRKP